MTSACISIYRCIPLIWICSLSIMAMSSLTDLVAFTLTLFLMAFARFPNSHVDIVSSRLKGCGEHAISKVVLELPPSDSYNRRVNFDWRYGIWPLLSPSASILMHWPSVVSDALMLLASTRRWPSAAVFDVFSEPARSTKHNFPSYLDSSALFFCPTKIMITVWDREETAFIFVDETARLASPIVIIVIMSSIDVT